MMTFDNLDLTTVLLGLATCYVSIVQILHYQRRLWMSSVATDALAARNQTDQTGKDDTVNGSTWRVHNLLTAMDLRFEAWLAMSMRGLLSTYAIPSIASLLHSTGGFQEDIQRRYADMELLIREFNENAIDRGSSLYPEEDNGTPERAITSIYRVNAIHSKYAKQIKYKDMLYVWSVFAITPSIFCESRWSIRAFTQREKECVYWHWVDIGRLLNLDITAHFSCYNDVQIFKAKYEEKYMKYSKSNFVVSDSTIDYFLNNLTSVSTIKVLLKPLVIHIIAVGQETERCRIALGLPAPGSPQNLCVGIVVDVMLTMRAMVCRWLLPPLPLWWKDRLTGLRAHGDTSSSSHGTPRSSHGTPVEKGKKGNGCPFQMFYPTRFLDFNNTVYTPEGATPNLRGAMGSVDDSSKGYIIEHMGPRSIEKGKLVQKPVYAGHYDPSNPTAFSLY